MIVNNVKKEASSHLPDALQEQTVSLLHDVGLVDSADLLPADAD